MHPVSQPRGRCPKEVAGLTMYHGVRKLLGAMHEAKG